MVLEHKEPWPGPTLIIELPPVPRKYTKHILGEPPPQKVNLFNGRAVRFLAEDVIDHFNGSPKLRKDITIVMKHIPNDFAMVVIDRVRCRRTIAEKHMTNIAEFLTHKEISDSILLSCIRKWSLYIEWPLISEALAMNAAAARERLGKIKLDHMRWEERPY